MSTFETILTRAVIDPDFARQLFTDTNRALAPYNLTMPEIAQIQAMPRAAFMSHAVEAHHSLAFMVDGTDQNHDQSLLKVK